MPVFIAETRAAPNRNRSGAQIVQLALDLRLHVERLLALPDAPLVARDHELSHLVAEPLVGRRRRRLGELGDLGLDVERRLPARDPPVRLRLDELAYLLVRLRTRRGAAGLRPAAGAVLVPVHRQAAAPDSLVQPAAGEGGDHRHDDGDDRDPDDDYREEVGHAYSVPM